MQNTMYRTILYAGLYSRPTPLGYRGTLSVKKMNRWVLPL